MSRQSSGDVGLTQAVNISPENRPAENQNGSQNGNQEAVQMVVMDVKNKSKNGSVVTAADVEHWEENNGTTFNHHQRTKVQVSHV